MSSLLASSPAILTLAGLLDRPGGIAPQRVRAETQRLLEWGRDGSYILAPAHAVEGDVPLENMLAFIELAQNQRNANAVGASWGIA